MINLPYQALKGSGSHELSAKGATYIVYMKSVPQRNFLCPFSPTSLGTMNTARRYFYIGLIHVAPYSGTLPLKPLPDPDVEITSGMNTRGGFCTGHQIPLYTTV